MEDGEYQIMHFSPDRETETTEAPEDDIYGDMEDFDLGTEIEKAKEKNKSLEEVIEVLKREKESLTEALETIKAEQEILKSNISSLYQTAKTEIDRKDRIILDLRTELEDLKFRRVGKRAWQQNFVDHTASKNTRTDHKNTFNQYSNNTIRSNINNIEVEDTGQQIIILDDDKTHKENEIIKGNFEHNNYIDPRSQGNKDSYASNLAIIDLDTEDIEAPYEIESRPDSKNSGSIELGEHRSPPPDPQRSSKPQANSPDRSTDRDGKFPSKYSRSRSSGRPNYNDRRRFDNEDRRFDRYNRFDNFHRGREDYDRNRRGAEKFYNKYDDRFRDRNNRSRRDYQNDRFGSERRSRSQNRDPRQIDRGADRQYDRRNRSSSREMKYSENFNRNRDDKYESSRYRARSKSRSRSECDISKPKETFEKSQVEIEIDTVHGISIGNEDVKIKKTEYNKISYSQYKQRKDMEEENNDITNLEETRKELLEELKEINLEVVTKRTDKEDSEDVESCNISNSEAQTTITSEELEGKSYKKKPKKKLKIVTHLEKKVFNTPIKNYSEETKKNKGNDYKNKLNVVKKTTYDDFGTNKKLASLFEDISKAGIFRRNSNQTETKRKLTKNKENKITVGNNVNRKETVVEINNENKDGIDKNEKLPSGKTNLKGDLVKAAKDVDVEVDQKQKSKKSSDDLNGGMPSKEHLNITREDCSDDFGNKKTCSVEQLIVDHPQSDMDNTGSFPDVTNNLGLPASNPMKEETAREFSNGQRVQQTTQADSQTKTKGKENSNDEDQNSLKPTEGQMSIYKSPAPAETMENILTEVQSITTKKQCQTSIHTETSNYFSEEVKEKVKPTTKCENEGIGQKVKVTATISEIIVLEEDNSAKNQDKLKSPSISGLNIEENVERTINSDSKRSKISHSNVIENGNQSNQTETVSTKPVLAKRCVRSCSVNAKYLFESSSDEEDACEVHQNTKFRNRAKSICEEVSERKDPRLQKYKNTQKDLTLNKISASKQSPVSLKSYKIPKKKTTVDKVKETPNDEKTSDETAKTKDCKTLEKNKENIHEIRTKIKSGEATSKENVKKGNTVHKEENKTIADAGKDGNNKIQLCVDDENRNKSAQSINNDFTYVQKIITVYQTNENSDERNKARRNKEIGKEGPTTEKIKLENINLQNPINKRKGNRIDYYDQTHNNEENKLKETHENTKRYKNVSHSVNSKNVENLNKGYDKKSEETLTNPKNKKEIEESTKSYLEQNNSRKENKTGKESTQKDDNEKACTARSKTRKRKLSEPINDDTMNEKRTPMEKFTKEAKKIKIDKSSTTESADTKLAEEKKSPKRRQSMEKRQYSVPSNIDLLSTTDCIKNILKQTYSDKSTPPLYDTEAELIEVDQTAISTNLNQNLVLLEPADIQKKNDNNPTNSRMSDKKIILLSDITITPPKSRKRGVTSQNSVDGCQTSVQCNSIDVGSCQATTTNHETVISRDIDNRVDANNKAEERNYSNEIQNKENFNIVRDDLNITDVTIDEEDSSANTVIEKKISSPTANSGCKRKATRTTKGRKTTPEVKELRRSKRNLKHDISAEEKTRLDSSKDKNNEERAEKQIKIVSANPKPIVSFKSIFDHNSSPDSEKKLQIQDSLHLNHEGEIPVLRLEENHFSTLPNDIIYSNPDKNIMQLLDNMNISSMECDILKHPVETVNTKESHTTIDAANESLTFENFLDKASSTPLLNKITPSELVKPTVSTDNVEDKQCEGFLDNLQKTNQQTFTPEKPRTVQMTNASISGNNLPPANNLQTNTKLKNTLDSPEQHMPAREISEVIKNEAKSLSSTPLEKNVANLPTIIVNENEKSEIITPNSTKTSIVEANQTSTVSDDSSNKDKSVENTSGTTVGNISIVRRRRCRMQQDPTVSNRRKRAHLLIIDDNNEMSTRRTVSNRSIWLQKQPYIPNKIPCSIYSMNCNVLKRSEESYSVTVVANRIPDTRQTPPYPIIFHSLQIIYRPMLY